MIIKAPISLKPTALRNTENFIRDIACVTQRGVRPFIRRKKMIKEAIKSYVNPFNPHRMTFDKDFVCKDQFKRYMHIDLAHTKDAVGIAMGHVPYFLDREILVEPGPDDPDIIKRHHVKVPLVKIDFWGKIAVKKGEEIILSEVRELIYTLSKRHFYFGILSFDRFQSVDSIQILRSYGYTVGHFSVDRTSHILKIDHTKEFNLSKVSTEGNNNTAQQALKDVLYDKRFWLPAYNEKIYDKHWAVDELSLAQEDAKSGKIDHPPGRTIDVEQALAAVATHCVTNETMVDLTESEKQDEEAEDTFYKNREEEIDERLLSKNIDYSYDSEDPRDL